MNYVCDIALVEDVHDVYKINIECRHAVNFLFPKNAVFCVC